MKILVMSLALVFTVLAQAKDPVVTPTQKSKLQQELAFIGSLFETAYAPKAWKESHLGWNLQVELSLAQAQLAAAVNMTEARRAVADFISSTADYHVGYGFYLTETASLPFQVKTVEGKSLIVYIDRTKLSETAFPFQVGDELLTMDQVPVGQTLSQLMKDMGGNIPGTDLALADLGLTRRRAARGDFQVPSGPVTVSVKRASDDFVGTVQLVWDYTPEKLNQGSGVFLKRPTAGLFNRQMVSARARSFAEAAEATSNTYSIGVKKSFMPDLGARIWEAPADNTFDAYIYKNEEGHLIGVVRIFAYYLDDYLKASKDFETIIAHLEKHTSALIIDQHNNPGGSVFYLYNLASMLSDQALVVPKHRVAAQASDAKECLDELAGLEKIKNDEEANKILTPMLEGYPGTYQLVLGIQDYCQFLLKEFNSGKTLTEPYYLWGVDKITPSKNPYTKPIVILVNELDFSGGDFFPAILQDNKRVTVVGSRTAGAGGYVLEAKFPNSFGLDSINFTGSIAERVDLKPIENLGVTPDVSLPITVEDVRGGYKHYQNEIRTLVKSLVK